jgi:hypothetical protein
LIEHHRLHQVRIKPRPEAGGNVVAVTVSRYCNPLYGIHGANRLKQRTSVSVRESDIADDDVKSAHCGQGLGIAHAAGNRDRVSHPGQEPFKQRSAVGVIFHDQDVAAMFTHVDLVRFALIPTFYVIQAQKVYPHPKS